MLYAEASYIPIIFFINRIYNMNQFVNDSVFQLWFGDRFGHKGVGLWRHGFCGTR